MISALCQATLISQLQIIPQRFQLSSDEVERLRAVSSEELKVKKLLRQGRVEEAESRVPYLESLGVRRADLAWFKADLLIRKQEFDLASKEISLYLYGDKVGSRFVSGEPCMKIWSLYLSSRSKSPEESANGFKNFFQQNRITMPNSTAPLDVYSLKTNDTIRGLLWLSAYELRTGNLLRAKFYLKQARTRDPKANIPDGYDLELRRYRTIRTQEEQIEEAQGGFVMFDPSAVDIKLKNRLKVR